MSELQVIVEQQVGTIKFNYEEVKESLAAKMELYADANFTEDSKNYAKAEVAALRKIRKAIDDKRKEVKQQCLIPYKVFEEQASELISLVDDPICLIDKQVKAFEQKQKEEKRTKITELYDSSIGAMKEYLPLEKIYDSKWENAGTTIASIQKEIEAHINNTSAAVNAISAMISEAVPKALELYKDSLDMASAINYINNYEKQKAEILEREKEKQRIEEERRIQAEIDRAKAEERNRITREAEVRTEVIQEVTQEKETLPETAEDKIKVLYTVVGNASEFEQIEMFLDSIGVSFKREDATFR